LEVVLISKAVLVTSAVADNAQADQNLVNPSSLLDFSQNMLTYSHLYAEWKMQFIGYVLSMAYSRIHHLLLEDA
jgi:hypothetical protein